MAFARYQIKHRYTRGIDMATILRSDNKLKQTRLVDLIERVITPVLDMDFVNEVYSKNGQDFNDINDVLTVTHARNGFYDSNYAYKYNPLPNMVSISNHPSSPHR